MMRSHRLLIKHLLVTVPHIFSRSGKQFIQRGPVLMNMGIYKCW